MKKNQSELTNINEILVPLKLSHSINDDGIILKTTKLKETDLICTILTRYNGKISAIAKGARGGKSKLGGLVALFNHIDLKFTVGRNLDILNEANGNELFSANISKDYDVFRAASFMCDFIAKLISFEHDPAEQQFVLLLRAFRMLSEPTKLGSGLIPNHITMSYILRALSLAGLEFDIDNPQNSGVIIIDSKNIKNIKQYLECLLLGNWNDLAILSKNNPKLDIEVNKIIARFSSEQLL